MIKVALFFWDPSYRCFAFNNEDLTQTIKEYSTLFRIDLPNPDKIYYKELKKFGYREKLAQFMGVNVKTIDQRTKRMVRVIVSQRISFEIAS